MLRYLQALCAVRPSMGAPFETVPFKNIWEISKKLFISDPFCNIILKERSVNAFYEVITLKEIDLLLKQVNKIHFIGIGGSGMCPLAEILHAQGYTLTGSDNNESDTLSRIQGLNIPVQMGHNKANIGDAQMVIYTAAILPDNEELVYAKAHVPTFERAQLLGAMSRRFDNCIGVCGTHGKTTVSSMTTQVLIMTGLDPSAVIGGKLPYINSNGRIGKTQNFVCESCEFKDTFLEMTPDVAVILNVDADHLDYFGTLDNIKKSFRTFADKATKAIIYNGDDQNTIDSITGITGKEMISFGRGEHNDYIVKNVEMPGGFQSRFDVYHNGAFLAQINLNVPGEHNILNGMAAFVASVYSGAAPQQAAKALESFRGAGRRFEMLGERDGVTYADDYAHHPKELEVTLNAAMKMGYKHVWAVFQPFTYSRTAMLLDDFAKVLQIPDYCVMSEIMGSRERNTYDIYTKDLAVKIPGSVWFHTFDEIAAYVRAHAQPGDLVLTLGCGDIYKAAKIMLKQ